MDERGYLERVLSNSATSLVAIILKNLEILESEGSLTHELYKPLVRETIYNQFKYISKLLNTREVRFEKKEK